MQRHKNIFYNILLVIAIINYIVFSGLYIYRTSILCRNKRYFTLWDDAMISMRYAKNFARGNGLVWNVNEERVQGFSNMGITLLMSLIHLFPIDVSKTSLVFQILNLVILLLIFLLVLFIAKNLFNDSNAISLAAFITTSFCYSLLIWSLQGSDAGFIALWITGIIALLVNKNMKVYPNPFCFWAVMGLGLLLRVDTIMIYGIVTVSLLLFDKENRIKNLILGLTVLFVIYGCFMIFNYLYYGDLLPNTFYLKLTGIPIKLILHRGWQVFIKDLARNGPLLIFASISFFCTKKKNIVSTCLLIISSILVFNIIIGGDWLDDYGSRFVAPVFPLILILASGGLWYTLKKIIPTKFYKFKLVEILFFLGIVVMVLLSNKPLCIREWCRIKFQQSDTMYRDTYKRYLIAALYLNDNTLSTTSIGVHWAGVLPYFCERPMVDFLGLNDKQIAKKKVNCFDVPGHSKWDWDYIILERRPDIILVTSRGLESNPYFLEYYNKLQSKKFKKPFYVHKEAIKKILEPNATIYEQ